MNYRLRRNLTGEERSKLSAFSDIVAGLMYHRGITDNEVAAGFVAPDYDKQSHDPLRLKDAEKAARRIVSAMKGGEKIAIYSDYDSDGVPGAAMWNDFFHRAGFDNFRIYIPHRHEEGFGLNGKAVASLAADGVKLIVTVDCGIADVSAVEKANEAGVEVIITDHHEPGAVLPPAFAIVDHKQKDCAYPDKNLCGTAVSFKLIQAILSVDRFGLKDGMEKWLLDLVGIATLSDMVSLTGENRMLAYYGLSVLRKSRRKGLNRLLETAGVRRDSVSEDDIGFSISPRLNAASRMGVSMDAFRLLATDDEAEAGTLAARLDRINNERKGAVAAMTKEIKKIASRRYGTEPPPVIVMGNPEWRPSLLGLAANSCAGSFGRPVFLWGRDGADVIKGSCRSEGRTDVFALMNAAEAGTFEQFGGHRHSGGFSVASPAIHFLEEKLNHAYETLYSARPAAAEEFHEVDVAISMDDVRWDLYDEISRLAPFGVGNPKPLFLFRNVRPESVRRFGKGNEHVELIFRQSIGGKVGAVAFFGAEEDWVSRVGSLEAFDLVACLEKSNFRSRPELRLRVVDIILRTVLKDGPW